MPGSPTLVVPGTSLCLFFPSPGAVASAPAPLAPSPLRRSRAPLQGIHSLPNVAMVTAPAHPAPPAAPSTSLHPQSGSARLPTCHAGRAPEAGPELLHRRSTHRAVSGELCSPGLHHSQALHPLEHQEEDMSSKIPMVDADTRRALCSQPLAQEHHGGSRKAQGAGGGAAVGVSGSKKHHANALGFSRCSPILTTAILSKSKSKGELWLHPYLWQSHLLSPTPPWEAWHNCVPVQLEGLSLTDCAPHGCYVGASPVPEHWAKAAGLERDRPAPSEGVCRQDQRPQEGDLTRRLGQITASKCSQSPAQAVKHRLPPPGASQSVQQRCGWD